MGKLPLIRYKYLILALTPAETESGSEKNMSP
jgi:hypothetical protein